MTKTINCAYIDCRKVIPATYGAGTSMSRHDNMTLICSDCGTAEALVGKPKELLKPVLTLRKKRA